MSERSFCIFRRIHLLLPLAWQVAYECFSFTPVPQTDLLVKHFNLELLLSRPWLPGKLSLGGLDGLQDSRSHGYCSEPPKHRLLRGRLHVVAIYNIDLSYFHCFWSLCFPGGSGAVSPKLELLKQFRMSAVAPERIERSAPPDNIWLEYAFRTTILSSSTCQPNSPNSLSGLARTCKTNSGWGFLSNSRPSGVYPSSTTSCCRHPENAHCLRQERLLITNIRVPWMGHYGSPSTGAWCAPDAIHSTC